MNLLREEKPPQWKEIKFSTSIIHEMVFPVNGALDVLKQMGYTEVCSLNYSGCQKYESSPIFVTKLEIRLYPEFLNTQICTFGPQICTLSTRTSTFCSTIASDFSASTFLPHLLTTLINLVLYKHEHEG